ncbi:MAG: helix-turn-helix transcriptional regulator [Planctomycetota bacterium]
MPVASIETPSFADSYVLVVDPDGTCVLNPRVPETVGQKPWEWCVDDDREACRESFVRACMFREEVANFETRMRYKERVIRLRMRLFPLDRQASGGQVLCVYHRVFDARLTPRERNVLALVAGGATNAQAATALGLSASTIRDYVAAIKRKLKIEQPEGFVMAAHHFGLAGGGVTSGDDERRG